MGSHQQFCLRWNNHQSNLLNVFEELLEQETLVDVTLACEGLSLKAHKVVLSACSPYFQTLFANNPCKHPIVILKDVKYVELKNVVDFMYKGEINVVHDQLDALLKVADTLQVKGLAEVTESFSLNRERYALSENDSNIESQKSTKKVTRSSQNNSSQSSGPACKRRRRHRGGGGGISNGETVEDLPKLNNVTRLEYPLPVKIESTSELYENHRSQSRTSKKANNVHLIEEENDIDSDLNIPFSSENVHEEQTNPSTVSTSSVVESNLLHEDEDLLDEELSRSTFYPSTSIGDDMNSLSGDQKSADSKGTDHVNVRTRSKRMSTLSPNYQERMQSACLAVASGLSFRQAAFKFELNAPTVWRYYVKAGRPQICDEPGPNIQNNTEIVKQELGFLESTAY